MMSLAKNTFTFAAHAPLPFCLSAHMCMSGVAAADLPHLTAPISSLFLTQTLSSFCFHPIFPSNSAIGQLVCVLLLVNFSSWNFPKKIRKQPKKRRKNDIKMLRTKTKIAGITITFFFFFFYVWYFLCLLRRCYNIGVSNCIIFINSESHYKDEWSHSAFR